MRNMDLMCLQVLLALLETHYILLHYIKLHLFKISYFIDFYNPTLSSCSIEDFCLQ